jgi:hypothetical protein
MPAKGFVQRFKFALLTMPPKWPCLVIPPTFINAVRSTGGRNSYRTLVVQDPSTDITKTNNLMITLPTDAVAGRLMVEVHYYTP